jgi:hypothetical protein
VTWEVVAWEVAAEWEEQKEKAWEEEAALTRRAVMKPKRLKSMHA